VTAENQFMLPLFFIAFLFCLVEAAYRPVVLMHGLGSNSSSLNHWVDSIRAAYPGIYAVSVSVDDGIWSGLVAMDAQVAAFASTVQLDPNLWGGFNLVCASG
jgi:hypothetical protein